MIVKVKVRYPKKPARAVVAEILPCQCNLTLSEEHISFVQATLGCEIDIETVDGTVTMKIPAGTQSGTDFKLSGHGVPHLRSESRGAHIVSIVVDTPTKLSKKQRELLEQFDGAAKRGLFS